jgi:DNA-directed RNA polymerase specialized sigma subunit
MKAIKSEEYLYLVDEVLNTRRYRRILAAFRIERDDAYQIGSIGLLQAVQVFNPERGTFQAIAVLRIKRELNKHFRYLNRQCRQEQALSLNVAVWDNATTELIDLLTDAHADFDALLTSVTLDKLAGPEKQLMQLLYYQDINRGKEAIQSMAVSEDRYYRVLKSLKKQILEIFCYEPERSVQYA